MGADSGAIKFSLLTFLTVPMGLLYLTTFVFFIGMKLVIFTWPLLELDELPDGDDGAFE